MTSFERRQRIIGLVKEEPGLRVPEIARLLQVSEGTVRNDLRALSQAGQLLRVRGGAAAVSDASNSAAAWFAAELAKDGPAKQCIARAAAELVCDGDSILLDASTTVYHLARALVDRQNLRVVTNGIEAARLLSANPANSVILIGGVVNPNGASVAGLLSEQIIASLHVNKAFVSCSGFSLERGLTEIHLAEADIKRKAIASADQVYALVTSAKIGRDDLTVFARLNQITRLFTDAGLQPEWVSRLKDCGVPFELCTETS